MNIDLKCNCCGETFSVPYKQRNKKYCGRACYFKHAKQNKSIGKKKDYTLREDRVCVECGKIFNERIKHEKKICSDECRKIWNQREENKIERVNKSKISFSEKYGVDSIFKTEKFKKQLPNIMFKKYGVHYPMHIKESVDKLKDTIKKKHLKKLLPKLKEKNLTLLDEYFTNKSGNTSYNYTFKCDKCDSVFSSTLLGSGRVPICRKCYPISKNSSLEQVIKDYLNEKNINFITSYRKNLDKKEIDVFIPSHNLGLEINGNYFHSDLNGNKSKKYHINKTKLAYENGINLIHFYEDEILLKTKIVISKIASKLNLNKRLYARKCVIKEVTKSDASKFLDENHLQGNCVDKHRYGLYFNDELVSVITFGKKRISLGNKNNESSIYELIRFCNKNNTTVVGGFSKLLKHFIQNHKPTQIDTFADIRWSGINPQENVYHKNGFSFINTTPPNYWYINTSKFLHRYHRYNFRKDVLVKEGYTSSLTEWEIMQLKGYDRIWDCGSLKYSLFLQ